MLRFFKKDKKTENKINKVGGINNKKQFEEQEENTIEKLKLFNDFKVELSHNFTTMTRIYEMIKLKERGLYTRNIDTLGFEGILLDYLIVDMYGELENVTKMSAIKEIICSRNYIYKVINDKINLEDRGEHKNDYKEVIESAIKIGYSSKKTALFQLVVKRDFDKNEIDEYIKGINFMEPHDDFISTFLYAMAFSRSIILARNIEFFINSDELYKIYKNLADSELNLELIKIGEKIYPIYQSFYGDVFDDELDKEDFYILLEMLSAYEIDKMTFSKNENPYEEEINKFSISVRNYGEDDINSIIEEFELLLERIENKKFFDYNSYNYDLGDKYIETCYLLLLRFLIYKIIPFINLEILVRLLDYKYTNKHIMQLKKKHETEVTYIERERLLRGDLSKEINYKIDTLSFKDINSGYQFEEYLKGLFEDLDFFVEITKGSGDQGADLLLEKDNIKIVVQAKFYTHPVNNKAVQEVVAAKLFYNATECMVVTNSTFTKSAIELAKANNVTLIRGSDLDEMKNRVINKLNKNGREVSLNEEEGIIIVCAIWNTDSEGLISYSVEFNIKFLEKYGDYLPNENWIVHYLYTDRDGITSIMTIENNNYKFYLVTEISDEDTELLLLKVYQGEKIVTGFVINEADLDIVQNYYQQLNNHLKLKPLNRD